MVWLSLAAAYEAMFSYDSLSVLGTLLGTILVILKILKIKLYTHVISFNTIWDEESEIFL